MVRMCCPHFTDEQIEAQRGEACCLKTHSDSIWTQAQRTLTLKPVLLIDLGLSPELLISDLIKLLSEPKDRVHLNK